MKKIFILINFIFCSLSAQAASMAQPDDAQRVRRWNYEQFRDTFMCNTGARTASGHRERVLFDPDALTQKFEQLSTSRQAGLLFYMSRKINGTLNPDRPLAEPMKALYNQALLVFQAALPKPDQAHAAFNYQTLQQTLAVPAVNLESILNAKRAELEGMLATLDKDAANVLIPSISTRFSITKAEALQLVEKAVDLNEHNRPGIYYTTPELGLAGALLQGAVGEQALLAAGFSPGRALRIYEDIINLDDHSVNQQAL